MTHTRLSLASTVAIILAMVLIALADAQFAQVSLWLLYIGPVVAASREAELRHGVATALLAALLLAVAAGVSGHPYASDLYFLVATASKTAALLLFAWFANRLASTQSLLLRLLASESSQRA